MKKKIKTLSLSEFHCKNCVSWPVCKKRANPSNGKPRDSEDYGCILFSTEGESRQEDMGENPD